MSRNIMTITKWLPLESEEHMNLFSGCRQLEHSAIKLFENIEKFVWNIETCTNDPEAIITGEYILKELETLANEVESTVDSFKKVFNKLNITGPPIASFKSSYWQNTLQKAKIKLLYSIRKLVQKLLSLFVNYGQNFLILILRISNMYNECLDIDNKQKLSEDACICSNMCPYLLYPLKRISVSTLLQILSQNRAETCCHKLIDCLLDVYKSYDATEEDSTSDSSSVEIYKAIANHMSPLQAAENASKSKFEEMQTDHCFIAIEELLASEENKALQILIKTKEISPNMLDKDIITRPKYSSEIEIKEDAKKALLNYYQLILWIEVGTFLEHVILWWGASPLSARPPHSSQHLREWINQLIPKVKLPDFVLAALTSLADALGVHVVLTSWDQQFQLALIASKAPYTLQTGRLFSTMLSNLVYLCNQCEVTNDWILGAPLDELPLVEQIPIFHRLGQLDDLRMACHLPEIQKGGLGVHVEVCAKMREKLISEVKENHEKLKAAPKLCVDNLCKICRTVSLAHLQMIFPNNKYWKQVGQKMPDQPSPYIEQYLNEVLAPLLMATHDVNISNMVLKIMCECLLDHIYANKIKFSHYGAYQLLTDFYSIGTWIVNCKDISQETRKKMLRNEVLRRCEGVGKLLLRSPGEKIKMEDKFQKMEDYGSDSSDSTQLMPAEMYVPNQQQWLALRARKRSRLFTVATCCNNNSD
ncbi:uncharacterized protein LOC108743606 isoform X2 [Agrilus planipennis]|uniref:Uncharacterized protein LOC108743606 isoform X2 n=1 Tax=Agrilus planipennis TaxID=224129 RepID=A0A1W4XPJ0_AGRPL|nr:uncharacterized protein LOC108743606 isoform X2 [Agrilus planipennis]